MQIWFCLKFVHFCRILIASRNVRITITRWLPKRAYKHRHQSVGFHVYENELFSWNIIYSRFVTFWRLERTKLNEYFIQCLQVHNRAKLKIAFWLKLNFLWRRNIFFNHKLIFNATSVLIWVNDEKWGFWRIRNLSCLKKI